MNMNGWHYYDSLEGTNGHGMEMNCATVQVYYYYYYYYYDDLLLSTTTMINKKKLMLLLDKEGIPPSQLFIQHNNDNNNHSHRNDYWNVTALQIMNTNMINHSNNNNKHNGSKSYDNVDDDEDVMIVIECISFSSLRLTFPLMMITPTNTANTTNATNTATTTSAALFTTTTSSSSSSSSSLLLSNSTNTTSTATTTITTGNTCQSPGDTTTFNMQTSISGSLSSVSMSLGIYTYNFFTTPMFFPNTMIDNTNDCLPSFLSTSSTPPPIITNSPLVYPTLSPTLSTVMTTTTTPTMI